jgi:flagellar hook-basal body complex protein FliE
MIPLITAVAGVLSALSSISNLTSASAPAASEPADPAQPGSAGTPSTGFSDALNAALSRVDEAVASANEKAKALASGNQDVSLSDVMISLEQANLALQAASAVRDKIVGAYANVMNMPV